MSRLGQGPKAWIQSHTRRVAALRAWMAAPEAFDSSALSARETGCWVRPMVPGKAWWPNPSLRRQGAPKGQPQASPGQRPGFTTPDDTSPEGACHPPECGSERCLGSPFQGLDGSGVGQPGALPRAGVGRAVGAPGSCKASPVRVHREGPLLEFHGPSVRWKAPKPSRNPVWHPPGIPLVRGGHAAARRCVSIGGAMESFRGPKLPRASCAAAPGTTRPGGAAPRTGTTGTATTAGTTWVFACSQLARPAEARRLTRSPLSRRPAPGDSGPPGMGRDARRRRPTVPGGLSGTWQSRPGSGGMTASGRMPLPLCRRWQSRPGSGGMTASGKMPLPLCRLTP